MPRYTRVMRMKDLNIGDIVRSPHYGMHKIVARCSSTCWIASDDLSCTEYDDYNDDDYVHIYDLDFNEWHKKCGCMFNKDNDESD